MSVKQGGNKWMADIQVGEQRIRKSFPTKEAAEKFEVEAMQNLRVGKPVLSAGSSLDTDYTLEQATKRAFAKFWRGGKSEKTMEKNIKAMLDFFGRKTSICAVNTLAVDDYVNHLKSKGNSNGTIKRKLCVVSKTLKLAQDYGQIQTLPKIHKMREGEGRIRYLTREEEDAILGVMDGWGLEDLKDAFIVSIDTGCRHGELLKLVADDITTEGLFLGGREGRKAGNFTTIPLTTRAREVLNKRADRMIGRLFPYNGYWTRSQFDRIKNHLGLEDVVWHTLRHTTCSRLVQRGMPLTHVKEWMGHKAIQTTMRYAHLSTSHLKIGASLLEQ